MKKRPLPHSARAVRGLTLIELMVSLTIGLVVMLAVLSTYLGSSKASRIADAQGRMNEDAQAALNVLSQQLRMAGNNPIQANRTATAARNPLNALSDGTNIYDGSLYVVRGCDGKFSNITTTANISLLTCAAGTSTLPDSIAVFYEADRYNTVPTATGLPTDCLGQSLTTQTAAVTAVNGTATSAATASFFVADNRFYIGTSSAIVSPSLYCKGNGNATPQPLVENVEDMQFTYGTSPITSTATQVAGYLDAASLLTQTDLAALANDATRWSHVMTVRICVLMRSDNFVLDNAVSARYTKCDGTDETNPPDLRLRRAYSTTVVLRNRLTSFD